MILCIDIGNSNIVIGGYCNDKLIFSTRIATDRSLETVQYALQLKGVLNLFGAQNEAIEGIMLSSVVPSITNALLEALGMLCKAVPVVLCLENSGIDVHIDNPRELGDDILATAVAVKHCLPLPAAIIDMGTATTVTAMDAQGAVLGVAIMPGLYIGIEALTGSTSQLKGIALEAPGKAIGTNSADSMKSGAVYGNADMLDGILSRFERELSGLKTIVATGGASRIILPHCSHKIEYSPSLLLDGLYYAYLYNLR